MQHMELTAEESDVLREVVQNALKEIDLEIHRTDKLAFRDMLKRRRQLLEHLQEKLALPVGA